MQRSLDLLENEPAPRADFIQTGLDPLAHAFLLDLEELRSAAGGKQLFLLEGCGAVVDEAVVPDDVIGRLLGKDLLQTVVFEAAGISVERSEGK